MRRLLITDILSSPRPPAKPISGWQNMTEPEQICVQPVSAVRGYPGRSTVHPTYENSSICLFREQNKLTGAMRG
ncbi:ATP-dependent DNA helicase pfh1 [Fusarium oxysporum f. sp. albedinis]|nr:ATP-dependent DNA helicase pfh1 [Fusarium oxysporum f. sp. albedinis]